MTRPVLPMASVMLAALLASCSEQAAPSLANADEQTQAAAVEAAVNHAAVTANVVVPEPVSVSYACEPALEVRVRYHSGGTEDPEALVTVAGVPFKMDATPVTSGARYHSERGRVAGGTLSWVVQGDSGALYEGSARDSKAPERVVARCRQAD